MSRETASAEERAARLYGFVAENEQLEMQGETSMDLRALFLREIRAAESAATARERERWETRARTWICRSCRDLFADENADPTDGCASCLALYDLIRSIRAAPGGEGAP